MSARTHSVWLRCVGNLLERGRSLAQADGPLQRASLRAVGVWRLPPGMRLQQLRDVRREPVDVIARLEHEVAEDHWVLGWQFPHHELHRIVAQAGMFEPDHIALEVPAQFMSV